MKTLLAIYHWSVGMQERDRNAAICCAQYFRLVKWLRSEGLDIEYMAFDFSQEPVITGRRVEHIPHCTMNGKATKVNDVIRYALGAAEFLCASDSDIYLEQANWPAFAEMLVAMDDTQLLNFPMHNILYDDDLDLDSLVVRPERIVVPRGYEPCCGGMFVAPVAVLAAIGGMDERFTDWGWEDCDLCKRLQQYGLRLVSSAFPILHLPHRLDKTMKLERYHWQRRLCVTDETMVRNDGPIKKRPSGSDGEVEQRPLSQSHKIGHLAE
jgi:hypothetical protein